MNTPVVSSILFAHAPYAQFIRDSLGSITTQSYASLEVIVLGDNSKELQAALEPFRKDSRLTSCSQGDKPFLQAANDRMKEARGKYLGTWNSDDFYRPDHVKVLVKALEQDETVGGAFDNTEFVRDVPRAGLSQNGGSTVGFIVPKAQASRLAAARLTVRDILRDNFMTGPSSLIRKSAFEVIGGYDKDIYLNCDLHWFYRLAAFFPIRYVDYVGVRKRIHPLNNTAVNSHYEYGVRELENIRERYPEVYKRIGKRAFNQKLGRKYFRLGVYHEKQGEVDKAITAYRQAMTLRKWSFRYHWEYLRSSIGRMGRRHPK
jgi:glycosyltransferase involved in cell wall biosynthesis